MLLLILVCMGTSPTCIEDIPNIPDYEVCQLLLDQLLAKSFIQTLNMSDMPSM